MLHSSGRPLRADANHSVKRTPTACFARFRSPLTSNVGIPGESAANQLSAGAPAVRSNIWRLAVGGSHWLSARLRRPEQIAHTVLARSFRCSACPRGTRVVGHAPVDARASRFGSLAGSSSVSPVATTFGSRQQCAINQSSWVGLSLHPTAYSGLRPLPSAGELKR